MPMSRSAKRSTSSRSAACSVPTNGPRSICASPPPSAKPADRSSGAKPTASTCCARWRRRARSPAGSLPSSSPGHRYIDAPRGGFYAPLVEEKDLDALLFIGPNGALPEGLRDNPEIDALAGRGLPVVQITGGAAITGAAVNLMDPDARGDAVDAGIDDGKANALAVAELLG